MYNVVKFIRELIWRDDNTDYVFYNYYSVVDVSDIVSDIYYDQGYNSLFEYSQRQIYDFLGYKL